MNFISAVTTVGTRAQAQSMARTLVERKLAACAQITEIESFYAWNGSVQNGAEFRVQFKTVAQRYPELEAAIRELHSYELPEIHAASMDPIYPPYAQWIERNSSGR
jgi:periplasmic divalent cation tolerance protein